MSDISLSLPDPMRQWIHDQVASGRYRDASAYVGELISRDRELTQRREALARALEEGEASGPATRSLTEIWTAVKARHVVDV